MQNSRLPLNASIAAGLPRGDGGVAVVTQSGSYGMAVHALGQDEGLRVAKVLAAGNKAEISDAELLSYLRDDPDTTVICLLLESITEAREFFTEACLTTPHKPVIAVLGGRTSAGQRAALSHTAALATDDAARDAALRQAGVVRVRTGLQALDAARALSGQPVPRGRRVAVVTNSGGTGVELTDLLADQGLLLPELSQPLQDRLRAIMPSYASARNPVDMTPAWHLFTTVYPGAIEMLARSGEVDVVVPVLLQRSASAEVAAAVRDAVVRLRAIRCRCRSTCAGSRRGLPRRTPTCFGMRTFRALRGLRARRRQWAWQCGAGSDGFGGRDGAGASGRSRAPQRLPRTPRTPRLASALRGVDPGGYGMLGLERRGLPGRSRDSGDRTVRCRSAETAAAAAERLGYPAVVKVDHPELIHKSDAGGVC